MIVRKNDLAPIKAHRTSLIIRNVVIEATASFVISVTDKDGDTKYHLFKIDPEKSYTVYASTRFEILRNKLWRFLRKPHRQKCTIRMKEKEESQ